MDAEAEESPSSNLDPQYPPDVKSGFDELCPVCGDKVSGYHYGLLTCESCKGFFKRTVQNKKNYACVENKNCQIDKSQRKRCPFCRFQKCLYVGMKIEAVRKDRMRGGRNKFGPMYKRDRALKQQQMRSQQRLMSECELNMQGPPGSAPPGSPPDIKPDPALLQQSLVMGNYISPSGFPGNPADISNMAAAVAAAVVGASSMGEVREGLSAAPITTSSSSGSYRNLGHPSSLAGSGRGMHRGGGGGGGGGGGSPLQLDERGALNLHTPLPHHYPHSHPPTTSTSHHNGFHPAHSNNNNNNNNNNSNNNNNHSAHLPPHLSSHHHHNHHSHQPHPLPLHPHHHHPLDSGYLLQQAHHSGGRAYPRTSPTSPTTPTTISTDTAFGRGSFGVSPQQTMEQPNLPPLLCEIKANLLEEGEMKMKMLSFLQDTLQQMNEVVGHAEQLLPVVCRMVDQLLFLMVEWARSSPFFKEIQVEDQMKLLQHSWSEILILDFVYRQVQEYWGTELMLSNGSRLNFDILDKLDLADVRVQMVELIKKARELKLDYNEYMCLKFLILLNPDISGLENKRYVEESQEKVNTALVEYCRSFYPTIKDKFSQILLRLPEIRIISIQVENFLYVKHLNNQVPDQTLLTEMLHSRRK